LSSTRIAVDGQPIELRSGRPIYLAPGSHHIGASAAGFRPRDTTLVLAAGEQQTVRLEIERAPDADATPAQVEPARLPVKTDTPPPAHRSRTWTWVAAGGAVARSSW